MRGSAEQTNTALTHIHLSCQILHLNEMQDMCELKQSKNVILISKIEPHNLSKIKQYYSKS